MRLKKKPSIIQRKVQRRLRDSGRCPVCGPGLLWGPEFVACCSVRGAVGGGQGERSKNALWEKAGLERKVSVEENGTLLLCRESTGRAWKLAKLLSYKAPFHRKVVVIQEGPLMKPLSSTHAKGQ